MTQPVTLTCWPGYLPVLMPRTRCRREKGKSRSIFSTKVKLLIDTFVGFSYFPIRLLSVIGLLVAMGSYFYGAFVLSYGLFFGEVVKGWVPTIMVLTFTSGIQMAMLGVLGGYLWRTPDEVRRRPSSVNGEIYPSPEPPGSSKSDREHGG